MKAWYPLKYSFWKFKWRVKSLSEEQRGLLDRKIDVNKFFRIDPFRIQYCSQKEFGFKDFKGVILDGDWDILGKRFDQLDIYQAIDQVCLGGKCWSETAFYKQTLLEIKNGKIHYGCQNEAEFIRHCHGIEMLFQDIKENGYKSQGDLFRTGLIKDPLVAEQEITICVGRSGDLLFSDGAHRLAIAKLLNIPSIPVKIAVRHKGWINFQDELVYYASDGHSSKELRLYQPATHIDLADLPASHECANRYQLIRNNMTVCSGRLLDLGANLGYFCHRFEDLGMDCVAIENDPQCLSFLKRLARAENRKFEIIPESVLDCMDIRDSQFDVILALNIFHHFLKTHETYEKLIELLSHLTTEELYFESHLKNEQQMLGAYQNYSPEEFVEFIMQHTSLDACKLIGNMQDGRPIYKLYHQACGASS